MPTRRGRRAVVALGMIALALQVGCSATTLVMPNPPEAVVKLDGTPLPGNVLKYGRWIGNTYRLEHRSV